METFREFEHAGWEESATCAAYQDVMGTVVGQAVEPLLHAAQVVGTDRLVDVATGFGLVAAAAARRCALVLGVDFAAEQVRRARAQHAELGFVRAEAEALPLATSSVDVVVSSFGVPHFPDTMRFLRECARVLRPAGRLAFTVWAPPPRSPTFAALFSAVERYGTPDVGLPPGPDFFRYTEQSTAAVDLGAAGFADVSVDDVAQTWTLPTAADAIDGLLRGTVRIGALLSRQPPGALDRVRRSVAEQLAAYDDGGSARIPMPAVVVRATRP